MADESFDLSHQLGRRNLLRMALASAAVTLNPGLTRAAAKSQMIYWGTYTAGGGQFGNGASQGIYVSRMDSETGRVTTPQLAAVSANPSWLTMHPNRRYLYAANELIGADGKIGTGEVSAFSVDPKSGKLTELNRVSSRGGQPCHVATDKTGKMLMVANWYTGSVAAFPIDKNGSLGESTGFSQHEGPRSGEAAPGPPQNHCHSVVITPDNRFLLSTNTGLNRVYVYRLSVDKATITPHDPPFLGLQKPTNPRHLALHPNGRWAYVANEINPGGCTMLRYDAAQGVLAEGPVVASVPPGFTGRVSPAECVVHPSGKFVYEANRGHNSIAVFQVNPADGTLTMVDAFVPGGETPRSFSIDPSGRFLIAMMQKSNTIVPLRINQDSGKLTPNGDTLPLATPVCALFSGLS